MKIRVYKVTLLGVLLTINTGIKAQVDYNKDCLDGKFENNCYSSIKSAVDGYVYLRSKAFSSQYDNEVNFSVLLKKGIPYVFSICEGAKGKDVMVMNLYNNNNKLIATSVDGKITITPEETIKCNIASSFGSSSSNNNCCIILFGMINRHFPAKLR